MFDEGQKLPSPYHRTKFESEKLVREQATVPWRVYRPSLVVGDSQTGEMDKIDGPVLLLQGDPEDRATCCRSGSRWSASSSAGRTSCRSTTSPRAIDHIAHQPDLDGQAFHLIAPKSQRSARS